MTIKYIHVRNYSIIARYIFLLMLVLFFSCFPIVFKIIRADDTAWHQTYTPYRNVYVSPTGVGGQAVDYSGNNDSATLFGQPTSSSGKVTPGSGTGYALDFNGTSNYAVLDSDVAAWGTSYTIESWVKTTSSFNTRTDVVYPILGNWSQYSSGGVGQAFGIEGGKLTFTADESSGSTCLDGPMQIQGSAVDDGLWHHVAMTLNSSSKEVILLGPTHSAQI